MGVSILFMYTDHTTIYLRRHRFTFAYVDLSQRVAVG